MFPTRVSLAVRTRSPFFGAWAWTAVGGGALEPLPDEPPPLLATSATATPATTSAPAAIAHRRRLRRAPGAAGAPAGRADFTVGAASIAPGAASPRATLRS